MLARARACPRRPMAVTDARARLLRTAVGFALAPPTEP